MRIKQYIPKSFSLLEIFAPIAIEVAFLFQKVNWIIFFSNTIKGKKDRELFRNKMTELGEVIFTFDKAEFPIVAKATVLNSNAVRSEKNKSKWVSYFETTPKPKKGSQMWFQKFYKTIIVTSFLNLIVFNSFSQPSSPPGGGAPACFPTCIPIDQGTSLILVVGGLFAVYFLLKLSDKKKEQKSS